MRRPAWRRCASDLRGLCLGLAEVDGRGPEGLSTDSPCWQIAIRPEGVEAEDADDTPSACAPPPRAACRKRRATAADPPRAARSAGVAYLCAHAQISGGGAAASRAQVRHAARAETHPPRRAALTRRDPAPRSVRGVSNADVEELQKLLEGQARRCCAASACICLRSSSAHAHFALACRHQAAENLGMAMVFTLSTFAREWLREKAKIEEPLDEAAIVAARLREEEAEEARREAERAAGTPVTAETYAAWWERFSAEMAASSGASDPSAADKAKGRLTGRRYFETRGEAVEEEAEGEASDEGEEEEGDDDDEDDDEEEWDPDALGSSDDDEDTELLEKYLSKR